MVARNKYNIKATYAMSPQYITIHNTANTASARNEVSYMRRNNNMTSYHVAIDDKEAVQAIPFNRAAWHCGDGANGTGNRRSIGIEICYSMDNGYSGAYSARYRKAEENTALYAAYVLDQYGWGVNRLRQHWNWSRKDCPHKMRAHGRWNIFKNRVQQHLNAIKKGNKSAGSSSSSKPAPKKSTSKKHVTPKASGNTYKVRKGDSLWSIAKANGTTAKNLKSINNLKSNTIKIGQTIRVKGTAKKSSSSSSSSKSGFRYIGKWSTNRYGTQWIKATGKFTVTANGGVYIRNGSPFTSSPSPGKAKKGATVNVIEIARQDGHVWVGYRTSKGGLRYIPFNTWNSRTGAVGKTAWGKFS